MVGRFALIIAKKEENCFDSLADSQHGDVLLVEQVDRLSRLTADDWEKLKIELTARRVRVVALDLPTSWTTATKSVDEFTGRLSLKMYRSSPPRMRSP